MVGGEGESVTVELGSAAEIKNIELDEKLKRCLQTLNACFWRDGKDSIEGTLTINFKAAAPDVADQADEKKPDAAPDVADQADEKKPDKDDDTEGTQVPIAEELDAPSA